MASGRTLGMMTASWVNVALGALVFATPFFTAPTANTFAFWSALVAGGIVAILGLTEAGAEAKGRLDATRAPSVVNLVAAAWLIIYPLATAQTMVYTWILVGSGIVIGLLELFNLASSSRAAPRTA